MYRETKPGSHIWEIKDEEEYPDGWYFSDETERFGGGPYKTEELAMQKCKEYCEWLDSSPTNPKK